MSDAGRSVSLKRLLWLCGFEAEAARMQDSLIRAVVQDSRKAGPQTVFVAIKGTKADGNAFIADAVRNGAELVISQEPPPGLGPRVLRVRNARRIYALLNHFLYDAPSASMKTFAVTGTNGKTTTSYLIRAMAGGAFKMGLTGTIQSEFAGRVVPATHTTPDPEELHSLLHEMKRAGCDAVVMEASSHALDQERLAGIAFDAAVFTNLTQDHLDYHGTMENYFEAKTKLLNYLKESGTAVLNADDRWFAGLRAGAPRAITYAIDAAADLKAEKVVLDVSGSRFEAVWQGRRIPVASPLIGRHNVYNVLGALGACIAAGVKPEAAAAALSGFPGVAGRLERVDAGQDFALFVDYAHTDDGLKNVLSAVKPFVKGRLLVLFGCGGNRDRGKRPKMARVAQELADFIVLTSDNPRTEDPAAILKEVESGFAAGFKDYEKQADRKKAIRSVLLKARKGDVVVLAGKGHEDYQVIGEEKVPFSDREEAGKVLAGK